jgi:hypothetical protein
MTLDEITGTDKELLAARYEAAISEEFGAQVQALPIWLWNLWIIIPS